MVRMQRGRRISLGGSPVVGGRPAATELRAHATAPGGHDYVMMAGGSEVGRVILLPGGYDPRGDWFWSLRDGAASCDAAIRGVCGELARDDVMARGDDYVRFNQYEDALASLELVALVVPLVRRKPQYWKWVIVGAHNALQGAMVCAYADSTGTSVLDKKSAGEMLDWLNADQATRGPYPKEHLALFGELLKRCVAGIKPIFEPLVLTPKQRKDIKRLHDHFRNNFAHFTPKGWSIEKAGLPRIIRAALDAAEELMHRDYVIFHMDDDQQKRLTNALATARKHLR